MGFAAFLEQEFTDRKQRNPRYSLRAFGRDLGCDHSTLSQWLRGRRTLTPESIEHICRALGLDESARAASLEFEPFALDVLRAAQACEPPTTPVIAAALSVTADRVNIALHRLLRLRLLRMEGGKWIAEANGRPA